MSQIREPEDASSDVDAEELFGESEDDLENLHSATTFDAFVVSSDWTTETLLGQIDRANIELDPIFQRRDAWDRKKKSRFIESLIVGLPVPQIVLAERKSKRGKYIVLDGKQRLLTLIQFAKGDFKLTGLELRSDLNRHDIDSMPADEKLAFETQTLRTMVVRHWQGDEFLYLVFHRLNTGSVPLSPQELRQALHPGDFVAFVNEFTTEDLTFARLFGRKDGPDFRMRDVELLVRYFAFARFLPAYSGNLKYLLDLTCSKMNSSWKRERQEVEEQARQCSEAIRAISAIFRDKAFRRHNGEEYERPFNRAVFDIMCFYAGDPATRARMIERSDEVRRAFEDLSGNARFVAALTSTTKSLESVETRLIAWGRALERAIEMRLPVPVLTEEGRIAYSEV
ncbi:hypothetical protein AQJ66_26865 [Streptomyces bungoensis]|uniref:GmrSD restriction endonucleases N-terminal domain-containing protein n=1 Tax=Streptomyces bungoensis TaxID=285568 RepID=A0A101SUC7_9ACTN|nr:DUF262 domain-containing protein [Streptomyces bungoensis]KUN80360.1 hypothetical protein AQJ66_26865 [Streptomyces bungoensis]